MIRNKVKEVVKNTLSEALSDQLDVISGVVISVSAKADTAKKLGTIGVVVGAGAVIRSAMINMQNAKLTTRINIMESDLGKTINRIDELEDELVRYMEYVDEEDYYTNESNNHESQPSSAVQSDVNDANENHHMHEGVEN